MPLFGGVDRSGCRSRLRAIMNHETVDICLNGVTHSVARGTPASDLLPENNCQTQPGGIITAVRVNNMVRDLTFPLQESADLEWVHVTSAEGMRVYRSSLVFLMLRAAKEMLPQCRVHVKHSLSNGLYGEIDYHRPVMERDIEAVESRMRDIAAEDETFVRQKVTIEEAIRIFSQQNMESKVRLLKSSQRREVTIYHFGWYKDYLANTLVPSSGYLQHFKLRFYLPGFILEYPRRSNPCVIPPYVEQGKLANVYFEAERWQKNICVEDAAELNRRATNDQGGELIRVSEAYHEKHVAKIADEIAQNRDRLRVILIAGPSSSGKTTFAERLSVQLRVNGLFPVAIGLDNYFVERWRTPVDDDGNYDFEALEAIDVPLFNEHLSQLIQGQEIHLPRYNFQTGQREWTGRTLTVSNDQPLIIEGIHGLNDELTSSIPKGRKFKIYVSALTNLNLDDHTRIPTTDVRLLRRMVRDYQFRGYSAVETIERWPSVRRGEEKHIFPFQEDADVMFNSALVYELAVLKRHAEPLLAAISSDVRPYAEARRLLRFLSHFHAMQAESDIPCNSILREFVGGSCFEH